jgi:hypothetical protein
MISGAFASDKLIPMQRHVVASVSPKLVAAAQHFFREGKEMLALTIL